MARKKESDRKRDEVKLKRKKKMKAIFLASKSPNREISRTSSRDAAGANQQHSGGG